MRAKRLIYLMSMFLIAALASCQRRPLETADFTVRVNIEIDDNIVNYQMPSLPNLMRCIFYDAENGNFVTQAFLPPTGGEVELISDRTYDVLVYNFDTEATIIGMENKFDEIFAFTNGIPDAFRTKLRSRATKDGIEDIVYDPDHLYVGRVKGVYVPVRSVDSPLIEIDVKCSTVVETWLVDVNKIQGRQYIGSVAAVVTGLSESNRIATGTRSTEYVSVYFDVIDIDENGILTAKFNTFGYNPDSNTKQVLSLVFTDTGGKGHIFDVDVSDQFVDNPEQIIRVVTEIDIPEPEKSEGGGFQPEVDEWDDIHTDIII